MEELVDISGSKFYFYTFLEVAPEVSQIHAETDVPISKPFPVMGGHPASESGLFRHECFGLYHSVTLMFFMLPHWLSLLLQLQSFLWLSA